MAVRGNLRTIQVGVVILLTFVILIIIITTLHLINVADVEPTSTKLLSEHGVWQAERHHLRILGTTSTNTLSYTGSEQLRQELKRGRVDSTTSPLPCDDDCTRFRMTMLQNNSLHPKAAIYYLTRRERLKLLESSLMSLYQYFLRNFSYPVVIFHEKTFDSAMKNYLRMRNPHELYFQEVAFELPMHVNSSAVIFGISCISPPSYRHMCYFQAKGVYEQPILNGLDYVWRLDDDSELVASVNYDVFSFMRDNKKKYGYVKIHLDALQCVQGLWKTAEKFLNATHIKPKFFSEWSEPKIYYNNFEISSLSLWTSAEYKLFIDYVDDTGGIFYERWGDAPIKGIAVSILIDRNETFHFHDLAYRHGNFYTNSTFSSF